ncbi:MAG TPA: dienelactone hydrolase family protein [Gemmatimonadales bacterium]|jgi:carboxymethylenebutenolidase
MTANRRLRRHSCRSLLLRVLPALAVVGCAHTARSAPAQQLPADEAGAVDRLNASPRHGEYVKIDAGGGDSVRMWVSYPERRDKAPVVVVIHEVFGLSDWIRGVADQLAAEGYIAVAPDLLTGHGPNGGGTESVDRQGAVALIRTLSQDQINRRLMSAARYGTGLPAARPIFGTVGFCWGGGQSFAAAYSMGGNKAAVVYYGAPTPDSASLGRISAPVLGFYGGDDARVDASVPPAQREMARLHKPFDATLFEGAGHGFLRAQADRDGANLRASQAAWPRTIAFFREKLGR